jgi:hypothetical protein
MAQQTTDGGEAKQGNRRSVAQQQQGRSVCRGELDTIGRDQ